MVHKQVRANPRTPSYYLYTLGHRRTTLHLIMVKKICTISSRRETRQHENCNESITLVPFMLNCVSSITINDLVMTHWQMRVPDRGNLLSTNLIQHRKVTRSNVISTEIIVYAQQKEEIS